MFQQLSVSMSSAHQVCHGVWHYELLLSGVTDVPGVTVGGQGPRAVSALPEIYTEQIHNVPDRIIDFLFSSSFCFFFPLFTVSSVYGFFCSRFPLFTVSSVHGDCSPIVLVSGVMGLGELEPNAVHSS